jgi:hypothetical protein
MVEDLVAGREIDDVDAGRRAREQRILEHGLECLRELAGVEAAARRSAVAGIRRTECWCARGGSGREQRAVGSMRRSESHPTRSDDRQQPREDDDPTDDPRAR